MDTQIQELITGYVLGGLEAAEAEQLEALVARDDSVRTEVQLLQDQVHQLALLATPVQPPAVLKQRLMARVAASQQKQPVRASARPTAARSLSWAWAGVLALVVALGGWNVALRNENASLRETNLNLAQELDTTRAVRETLAQQVQSGDVAVQFLISPATTARKLEGTQSAPKASGTMFMQPGNDEAVLVVDGLQPLPEGSTYQFWLARANQQPVPSNTFKVDANGHAYLVVKATAQVNDFSQVMITIEPAAGSSVPSDGATVLQGSL